MTGWYGEHVLPRLLDAATDTEHTRRVRARVGAGLAGHVLEVGSATGHGLARVLRPGGQLRFVEHGLAPELRVRRWQPRLNPLQRRLVGGCTLDRDVPAVLRAGGMSVVELERYDAPGEPKALGATHEGAAISVLGGTTP